MGHSTVTLTQTIREAASPASPGKYSSNVSPFKMYFPSDFEDMESAGRNLVEDEYSLSDILSINSDCYDSYASVSAKMPSMSRVKKQRENAEEVNAAKKRIQQRLSSIGERRKEKKRD
jgi:hypothetical protein